MWNSKEIVKVKKIWYQQKLKVFLQGIHMWNMKCLPLNIQKLCPRLTFLWLTDRQTNRVLISPHFCESGEQKYHLVTLNLKSCSHHKVYVPKVNQAFGNSDWIPQTSCWKSNRHTVSLYYTTSILQQVVTSTMQIRYLNCLWSPAFQFPEEHGLNIHLPLSPMFCPLSYWSLS